MIVPGVVIDGNVTAARNRRHVPRHRRAGTEEVAHSGALFVLDLFTETDRVLGDPLVTLYAIAEFPDHRAYVVEFLGRPARRRRVQYSRFLRFDLHAVELASAVLQRVADLAFAFLQLFYLAVDPLERPGVEVDLFAIRRRLLVGLDPVSPIGNRCVALQLAGQHVGKQRSPGAGRRFGPGTFFQSRLTFGQ